MARELAPATCVKWCRSAAHLQPPDRLAIVQSKLVTTIDIPFKLQSFDVGDDTGMRDNSEARLKPELRNACKPLLQSDDNFHIRQMHPRTDMGAATKCSVGSPFSRKETFAGVRLIASLFIAWSLS